MHYGFIDYLGILGGALLLFGFWRTSIGKWGGKSIWYELDNLAAAALLSVYTLSKGAAVSVVINVVWGIVALRCVSSYAERRLQRRKNQKTSA